MPYTKQISSASPGLIIVLIDQSGSMADPYTSDRSKADFAALAVNRVVHEVINSCVSGDTIRPRVEIGGIGYNGNGAHILEYGHGEPFLDNVSTLAEHMETVTFKRRVADGAGGIFEQDIHLRAFVKPEAYGGTPMGDAFDLAREKIEVFVSQCPDSFPPVVINITDGEPQDFDHARAAAQRLTATGTSDGNTLLLNAHIDKAASGQLTLPNDNSGFTRNDCANFLYSIASVLPEKLALAARGMGFADVIPGTTRGFVFNADADTLVRFLNFGSDLGLR
jgi:hypothetical protein